MRALRTSRRGDGDGFWALEVVAWVVRKMV